MLADVTATLAPRLSDVAQGTMRARLKDNGELPVGPALLLRIVAGRQIIGAIERRRGIDQPQRDVCVAPAQVAHGRPSRAVVAVDGMALVEDAVEHTSRHALDELSPDEPTAVQER